MNSINSNIICIAGEEESGKTTTKEKILKALKKDKPDKTITYHLENFKIESADSPAKLYQELQKVERVLNIFQEKEETVFIILDEINLENELLKNILKVFLEDIDQDNVYIIMITSSDLEIIYTPELREMFKHIIILTRQSIKELSPKEIEEKIGIAPSENITVKNIFEKE